MKRNSLCAGVAVAFLAVFSLAEPAAAAPASPPVVGGTPTTIDEHPWLVAVARDGDLPYCGGSLVAPTKVVTAAH